MKKPINGRNKGAAFERTVAHELFLLTGIKFVRNLEQCRTADHGDLIADDPAWPFSCELKAYVTGTGCKPEWKEQSSRAAKAAGLIPCVIYKFNHRPITCAVPMRALCPAMPADQWADITLRGFAFLAAEIMAKAASEQVPGNGTAPPAAPRHQPSSSEQSITARKEQTTC